MRDESRQCFVTQTVTKMLNSRFNLVASTKIDGTFPGCADEHPRPVYKKRKRDLIEKSWKPNGRRKSYQLS